METGILLPCVVPYIYIVANILKTELLLISYFQIFEEMANTLDAWDDAIMDFYSTNRWYWNDPEVLGSEPVNVLKHAKHCEWENGW